MQMAAVSRIVDVILIFLLLIWRTQGFELSNNFKILPCSIFHEKGVLSASSVFESRQKTVLRCAASCNKDIQCDYAMFRTHRQQCLHLSHANHTNSRDTSYAASEMDCAVLKKFRKRECQNEGKLLNYVCQCPKDWTGRECEKANFEFCQGGSWREPSTSEYSMLTKSWLPIKLVLYKLPSKSVCPISHFRLNGGGFILQLAHSLSAHTGDFSTPLQRAFTYMSSTDNIIRVTDVGMTGTVATSPLTNYEYNLTVYEPVDDSRLFYRHPWDGSAKNLVDGLLQGYRLLHRELTRVGFDKLNNDAYFNQIRAEAGANSGGFLLPIYYYAYRETLETRKRFILRWIVKDGRYKSSDQSTRTHTWELDRCWTKINPLLEYDEFTNVLKEIILRGHDIRLVIGESVSTDVIMATITANDVIAILAEYLTPFDLTSPLNDKARIRFPLISRSKTLSECEKVFLRSTVYQKSSQAYDGRVDWFSSSRIWTKIFTVVSGGQAIFGASQDVYDAVIEKLNNVRVCIELSMDALWTCSGIVDVYTKTSSHIVVQTPATMIVAIHNDGTFAGIEDNDCKFIVMLVSTDGLIRKATYNPGTAFSDSDVADVDFVSISWFVEN